ncbi:hypothetical protein D9M72_408260 [compost metagenome]
MVGDELVDFHIPPLIARFGFWTTAWLVVKAGPPSINCALPIGYKMLLCQVTSPSWSLNILTRLFCEPVTRLFAIVMSSSLML